MSAELNLLKQHVRLSNARTIDDTTGAVFKYFKSVTWSLLKDEWTMMTLRQKADFCEKLHKELNL
jgi:hypothetical protein